MEKIKGGEIRLIERFDILGNWLDVKRAAMTTIGKDRPGVHPDDSWKKRALLAEHSMIRRMRFSWVWADLKSWVSVHFTRHKIGIEHFVSTQRTDRTGINRDELRQDTPVRHECEANAQALINISRKRLCSCASPDTRRAWEAVKREVAMRDPVTASVMVRECVYRGFCPEFSSCGYCNTAEYAEEVKNYRRIFE